MSHAAGNDLGKFGARYFPESGSSNFTWSAFPSSLRRRRLLTLERHTGFDMIPAPSCSDAMFS